MKILIISDTHGFSSLLEAVLKKERGCDAVIHLGDGGADMFAMREYINTKPFYQIKGNCDMQCYDFTLRVISFFDSVKFFACHGHTHNVKTDRLALYYAAKSEGCSLALYGHTHIPLTEEYDGVTVFNPGSISNGSYGILETEGKSFSLRHCRIV
ncbi:MAG: metallophosphoesterase [Clostridia bacterium]|nr:metallophosphoesterase [Clostridia bacterium]